MPEPIDLAARRAQLARLGHVDPERVAMVAVVAERIDHAANVDGATASPLLAEECDNLAMAVVDLLDECAAAMPHDKGRDCRRTDEVLENYRRRAVTAEARPPVKSLAEMAGEVMAWCERKGWEPDPGRSFGDEMALLHSEVSEALEAYRTWKFDDPTVPGEKPEGVAAELADVLIRLLHYSAVHGFDLGAEYERKMAYNERRPWRHGGRTL